MHDPQNEHPSPPPNLPRIAVGIATSGRSTILAETLAHVHAQTVAPAMILVSFHRPEDIADLSLLESITLVEGPIDLVGKRNRILDAAMSCDVVLFVDDDFFMASDYIHVTQAAFATHPEITVTTGRVIADGIVGPGLSVAEGRAALSAAPAPREPHLEPVLNGYGCNMAIRMASVRARALRFDERLPLYGWFEDLDFTRRAAIDGCAVKLNLACGVHLGTKTGRGSGIRLGYSQVVNPLYLARKGSCPKSKAVHFVLRNFAMNVARSLHPEPFIDRRGRLYGNLLAFGDLLRGTMHPERIIHL